MRKFSTLKEILVFICLVLIAPNVKAENIFSDAPFPWGSELPLSWSSLEGTWQVQTGDDEPLMFEFSVSARPGDVYLVSSIVGQGNQEGQAQGYAFAVNGQRHLNIAYFGEGLVPLAILRAYPTSYRGPVSTQAQMTLTWVWDANSPRFHYQHFSMEKISNGLSR